MCSKLCDIIQGGGLAKSTYRRHIKRTGNEYIQSDKTNARNCNSYDSKDTRPKPQQLRTSSKAAG